MQVHGVRCRQTTLGAPNTVMCFVLLQVITDSAVTPSTSDTDDIQVVGEDSTSDSADIQAQFDYSIKIVNPARMSEYKTVRVCKWSRCDTLITLRAFLRTKVPPVEINGETPNFEAVDIGYIEPGHGMKGKKQWLIRDGDIGEMYKLHEGKQNILLWAYSKTSSTKNKPRGVGSNFEQHKESLSEVDEKYDELRKKHGEKKYTMEQLRMWAQYIHLGKYQSMDEPPDKPFWTGRQRQHSCQQAKRHCVHDVATESPTKRSKVVIRSELLDQLGKWHKLNEAGVVSDSEYEDLKKTILSDIKQL